MRACPFCNYDEGWTKESSYTKPIKYRVECSVCGAVGPESKSREMAEKKWDGLLAKIEDQRKFDEALKEEAMGGVSSPGATLNNTPGMGNAVPAASAGLNSDGPSGSGDSWGTEEEKPKKKKKPAVNEMNLNPYDKIGGMMAKKMGVPQPFKKKDSRSNTIVQSQWEELDEDQPNNTQSIDDYVNNPDKVMNTAKKRKVGHIKEERYVIPTLDSYQKASEHVPDHPLTSVKKKKVKINEYVQYQDIEPGQKFYKFGDEGQIWIKIDNKSSKLLKSGNAKGRKIGSYDVFPSSMEVTPLNEGETLRDENALKDVKAKETLESLGIAYEYKEAKSGKDRVFITDPMKDVLAKLKQGNWEEIGKNPENTIRKYKNEDNILTIYAEGQNYPRATVTKENTSESLIIRKLVSNSIDPYLD